MRLKFSTSAFYLAFSFLIGATSAKASGQKTNVVAVDGVLCDLVRTVASKSADVFCVIPPTGDPHYYRLTPKDLKAISRADIIFHNGFT